MDKIPITEFLRSEEESYDAIGFSIYTKNCPPVNSSVVLKRG